jgi:type I restriction enzyme S subunit
VRESLPNGWALTTIGGVCVDKVAQRVPQEEFVYVDIGSVDNQRKAIVEPSRLAAKDAPSRARQALRHGDVLVSLTRPNLNAVALVPQDLDGSVGSTGFDVVRPVACETGWIFAFVRSPGFITRMSGLVQGALYPAVRPRDVRESAFPLPPLAEQRRIVAKLESLQARSRRAREALDALPPLLEKLRQSILASAFRGDLTTDWRKKHPDVEPATELLKRIRVERRERWELAELAEMKAKGKAPTDQKWKAKYVAAQEVDTTGLPELPHGWCWAAFDDLAFDSLYGPRFAAEQYAAEGFPTLRTTDLDDEGGVVWNAPPRVRVSDAEYVAVGLRPHDFVVTRTGATIGKCALYRDGDERALPSAYLIRFGLVSTTVDPEYTLLAMLSPALQAGLRGGSTATAQPNVNARTIGRLPVPVAPRAEQRRILAAVSAALVRVRAARAAHGDAASALAVLERATLAKAFRGELVPQDPNDEPADAMLARVRAGTGASTVKVAKEATNSTKSRGRGRRNSLDEVQ